MTKKPTNKMVQNLKAKGYIDRIDNGWYVFAIPTITVR